MVKSTQNHGSTAGTNLEHARSHNRRAVLEAVRLAGSLSRAEIARRTSLTIQTISNIVTELEEKGLLLAGEINRNPRGQPSIPYSINPAGASSIGFHIARHEIIGVLTDLTGKVLAQKEIAAETASPQIVTPIVTRMFEDLFKKAKVSKRSLLGVGVALPARFGLGTLSTAGPTGLPGWNDPTIRTQFVKQLDVPIFIENDAVAAAIGEHHYGAARGINNFVMLYLDEGLGAGLFLNGHLFKGALSSAGEVGHMIIESNGRQCPCGNRGCLERYVSLQAASEFLNARNPPQHYQPADVAKLSSDNLSEWIAEAAPKLSIAINILETVLDTETIVIGGLASIDIVESLISKSQPLHVSASKREDRKYPRVMAGRVGRHATALGAAALPIFDEMNPNFGVLLKQSAA